MPIATVDGNEADDSHRFVGTSKINPVKYYDVGIYYFLRALSKIIFWAGGGEGENVTHL